MSMKVHSAQGLTVMNTGDMHIKGVSVCQCVSTLYIFSYSHYRKDKSYTLYEYKYI